MHIIKNDLVNVNNNIINIVIILYWCSIIDMYDRIESLFNSILQASLYF